MPLRKIIVAICVWMAIVCWSVTVDSYAASGRLLGDENSGSRATAVHLIPLYDDSNNLITGEEKPVMPFSTRYTCGKCHDYNEISTGWHFNPFSQRQGERNGEPWILADTLTGTEVPLSYRDWLGTFKPEQADISTWKFAGTFGAMTPGGGCGELVPSDPNELIRTFVSGKFEINCFACHNLSAGQDHAEHFAQVVRQNFRWVAAASSGLAEVSGSAKNMPNTFDLEMPRLPDSPDAVPPSIRYKKDIFDSGHRVMLNISNKIPNQRCYACHSTKDTQRQAKGAWLVDEDVHIAAGMKCVDCHSEGLNHATIRGYVGEGSSSPLAAVTTCESCHIGNTVSPQPQNGRFAAPEPRHAGIPLVHFEKLTCTACHSGPWPNAAAGRIKTSMTHRLGTHNANLADDSLPHLVWPIFARNGDGKIAPNKMLWPAYWGFLKDKDIVMLNPQRVYDVAETILTDPNLKQSDGWTILGEDRVMGVLKVLAQTSSLEPVYVAGGKVHRIVNDKIVSDDHRLAQPYAWQFAHDIRPAAQSLGVRGCSDCHSVDSAFLFAETPIDSSFNADHKKSVKMIEFQKLNPDYEQAFAFSFVFRPWLKITALASSAVIGAILLFSFLTAVGVVLKKLGGNKG